MSEQISVSRVDVARAQLVVRLNQSLGRTTDPAIRKIADAPPAENGNDHGDGLSDGHGNGR